MKLHAAHQRAEVVLVAPAQRGVVLAGVRAENLRAGGRGVAADVVVVHEAGGRGEDERDGVCTLDAHAGARWLSDRPPSGSASSTAWNRRPLPSTGAISQFLTGIGPFPAAVHHQLVRSWRHTAQGRGS